MLGRRAQPLVCGAPGHPSLGFALVRRSLTRPPFRFTHVPYTPGRALISGQPLWALPLGTLAAPAFAQNQPPIRFSELGSATLSSRSRAPGRGKKVHLSSPFLACKSCGVEAAQEATEPSSVGGKTGWPRGSGAGLSQAWRGQQQAAPTHWGRVAFEASYSALGDPAEVREAHPGLQAEDVL